MRVAQATVDVKISTPDPASCQCQILECTADHGWPVRLRSWMVRFGSTAAIRPFGLTAPYGDRLAPRPGKTFVPSCYPTTRHSWIS
jgi:hypothetical protein